MDVKNHISEVFIKLLSKYSDDIEFIQSRLAKLIKAYSHHSRYYHNLFHISSMLTDLDTIQDQVEDPDCLTFSILYHDIVYKATKSDNEHRSALALEEVMKPTSFSQIEKCKTQIELTKHHAFSQDNAVNILMDLDLAILGSSNARYKTYCSNIRKEYQVFPDFLYYRGRRKVLKHFLDEKSIFKTITFQAKFENQARSNIEDELNEIK